MRRTVLLVMALLFTGAAAAQSLAFTGVTVIDVEEGGGGARHDRRH